MAEKLGDGTTKEMLKDLLSQFDTSGDGKVSYEEFKKAAGYEWMNEYLLLDISTFINFFFYILYSMHLHIFY